MNILQRSRISRQTILLSLMTAVAVYFFPGGVNAAESRPQSVMLNVPYSSQSPLGQWSDPRQMDGCEEASIVMAMAWARGANFDNNQVPAEEATRDIINMSEYEKVIYGFFQDTQAQDTARLMQEFYQYDDVSVKENISSEDIKNELAAGRVVIIPLDTRLTGLGLYRRGPVRHTVIAVGYDDSSNQILVHDPLFASGKNLWIPAPALDKALWNYLSGNHTGLGGKRTALISVGKLQ